jgi:outer membrane lipase/esterase
MRRASCSLFSSLVLSAGLLFIADHAQAVLYTDIVIFGDSLSDPGNLYANTGYPPAPYFNGQFSNGPVWASTFAQHFGFNGGPLSSGGHNYAFAGATTGPTGTPTNAPTLLAQEANYLTAHGGTGDPNALYVVFGGANDIRDALLSNDPSLIASGVGNVVNIITSLYGAGARNILVANVPNVGSTPLLAAEGPIAQVAGTFFSTSWNNALSTALGGFAGLPGLDLDLLDIFGLEAAVLSNPAAFGYTNTTQACYDGVNKCNNPDEYLYWDNFHPTESGHLLIAQAAITAVPEPATVLLFGFGLLGFAIWQRRAL